ncbi:cell volume regulation protein A [Propionibacterium cyclohexanicum]|uniref:Cell volume regulation protein A n=1 Tax=Propionibacterium cyclohexanicum TaxID=64702 RepID=A0A1H9SZ80_9ACTN|nr:potassium/proton antiporter [Propionibacterium cyclohexanicum]SER90178.1 cell volume regulation protein A [Propionibacterium cyclohexanicum]
MSSFDMSLLLGSLVVLVAIAAVRLGSRAGLPALLLFLLVGIVLGPGGFGLQFGDVQLAHDLGFAALVLILAEGGLTTKWQSVRPVLGLGLLLATVGVLVTIAIVGLFGYFVLRLSFPVSFLLGAIVAPTDAAAVFSVLRGVKIPARLRAALEIESGLNDAPTVLLVTAGTALSVGQSQHGGALAIAGSVVYELVLGVLLGLLAGWLGSKVMARLSLPASGLYPLATMAWIVFTYGFDELVHGSAFAAVYVCAVILGNSQLPHRHATRSFAEGIGWVAQMGLFVMLGVLVTPSSIGWGDTLVAVMLGLVLLFVARPVAVFICAAWFKVPWRHQLFMSWAGLRGAVPIILATVPLAAGMPESPVLFDIIVVFVVVFTCVQAPSLPWLARRLGLVDPHAATDVDIEVAPFEERRADLLEVNIPEGSRLAGMTVLEMRLPPNAVVSLIIRGEDSFSADGSTTLQTGDQFLVVTPAELRDTVERRLTELGRGGRLASWHRGGRRWRAERGMAGESESY